MPKQRIVLRQGSFGALKTTNHHKFNARAAFENTPASVVVRPLAEVEREAILGAIKHFDGNCCRAARALKIGVNTIYTKLKVYGVYPKEFRYLKYCQELAAKIAKKEYELEELHIVREK